MEYPEITIIDCTTGEVVVREMTKSEYEQKLADDKQNADNYDAMKKAQADLAKAKEAVLAKLGLTADEVAALLS
jgi:hypothetical protein